MRGELIRDGEDEAEGMPKVKVTAKREVRTPIINQIDYTV